MAAKPNKKMDAQTAAKAVEDALDVELTFDDLAETNLDAMSDEEVFNELERKLSAAAEDLKDADLAPDDAGAKKPAPQPKQTQKANANSEFESMRAKDLVPANDDRRDAVAELVYGLQQKASNASFIIAAILTAAWFAVVWYYVKATDPLLLDFSNGIGNRLLLPKTYLYIGIALIPVLMVWAFAVLLRRAQEMRQAARSMTEAAVRLMQPENIASDSISTVGHAIRREVAAMGDGVERALARAGELEAMVQGEVLNLQRSYSDSEIRLRTLLVDLGNERENVVGHAEKLRASISGSHIGLTDELNAASGRIQGVIDQATNQLSETLSQRESGIQATLTEAGQNLVSLLSNSGSDLENRIASGTKHIEDQLSSRTQDLTQQISMAGSAMANLLDTQSAKLEEQSNSSTRQFEDAIGLRISEFSSRFEENSSSLTTQLDSQIGALEGTLGTKGDAFVQALGNRTEALDKVLNDRTVYISDTLKERLTSFGQAMTGHLDSVNESMTSQLTAASSSLEERQLALEKTTEAIGTSIASRAERLEEGLVKHHADIAASLGNGLAAVSHKAEEIRSGLDAQKLQMVEGMDEKSKGLLAELDGRITSLVSGVEENAANLKTLMEQKAAVLADTLSSGSEILFTGLDTQTSNLRTDLEKRSSDLLSNLANQSSSFAENMEARVGAVNASVEENAASLLSGLDERNAGIDKLIASRAASLDESLGQHSDRIDQIIAARADSLGQTLEQYNASIDNVFASKASALNETLGKHASEIDQSIAARTDALNQGLDQRSQTFADGLEARVTQVSDTVVEKSASLLSSLEERAGHLGTMLADGETTIISAVESKYGLFSQMLADKQQAISIDLDQKIENTAGVIDEKAAAISDILTERAAIINSTLGQGLTDSQRMLETKTQEFNELLTARSTELSTILDETALPLVDQIKVQGDTVASNLGAVQNSLNEDVEGLLTRLGTVGTSMAELISRAGSDLSSMEQTITSQANNMTEAVMKARLDVDQSSELAQSAHLKMDETAKNLLANIGNIAERFEQQGRMLEQATGMIDAAQQSFSSTLDDKDNTLSNLAAGLTSRTEEIERSMATFGEMLTRTMDEMTQRSRLVGSTVSSEIGAAIEETTARYAAATDAMRQASQDVQRDLEETRQQMRRGVMELPDETKQSADAMRKVVADQIAALRDLSEIVTKSGKSLDTAAAVAPSQQRFGTNNQPRTLSAPMQPVASAPMRQPQAPAPRAPAVQSNLESILSPRAPAPAAPQPRPQAAQPSQRIPQPAPATGWVSDLLKRASVEEQQPTTRNAQNELHKIESLNALSMDIARLMDDEASVDLWERYQRGERNVFTRRLYTLQGQQTFDEIRNKYSREPEFRRAVDRYIDDFERLLGDVVQNDRDNIMTQTYLTSDTGKVYTMLAHASGRLGG